MWQNNAVFQVDYVYNTRDFCFSHENVFFPVTLTDAPGVRSCAAFVIAGLRAKGVSEDEGDAIASLIGFGNFVEGAYG